MIVRDIMDPRPPKAAPDESAGVAWERMHELGVDHLVVVKDDHVVGVVSRHDLGGPAGGSHRRMGRRVADLMQKDVVTATPASSVRRATSLMRRRGIGCLPVVERDRLVGLVTVTQLLGVLERALAE
jgi:acetoin utilization protein AcuB